MLFGRKSATLPTAAEALPGRDEPMAVPATHHHLGTPLTGPWPDGMEVAVFGMGCFWGVERIFWRMDGVHSTQAAYAGGHTPNPDYGEVCSGQTGHAEVVQVVFDPAVVSYEALLVAFWENHDPTQAMRQGNDVGTQYRSVIYTTTAAQARSAEASRDQYQARLDGGGYGLIETEIAPAGPVYLAEPEHQQYLSKIPNGYCNHGFCQVAYADEDAAAQA